jgi:hypothetical protein
VNETSWAHVWRLRFCFLELGCDNQLKVQEVLH